MMRHGKALAAQVCFYGLRVDFFLADCRLGKRHMAQVAFEETAPAIEGLPQEPSFSVSMDAAQEMFEQMWGQGFRSKHDLGGAAQLDAARKEHLADLRKVAKLG